MIELNKNEVEILEYWNSQRIMDKLREKNKQNKPYYFLDGPPYVTGELGAHHVWVETTKDIIVRYRRYKGFAVHDRAGFDVHGLPIEVKVEKRMGIASKGEIESKIGIDRFVAECKQYATDQAKIAIGTFMRFGSSLDFEHVYLPYENYYINKGWDIFKKMYQKKLLYKDLEPLAYCPRCQTVLSAQGPEVEYADETDTSIFVKFRINERSKSAKVNILPNSYLVIWTTTPWTLPANIAIAANPKALYVSARFGDDNYIVAKDRLEALSNALDQSVVINAEFYGSQIEGVRYTSPLEYAIPVQKTYSKYHKVIMSESFVSVKEGTGLLHVAPGHGPEDYRIGKLNKLPIFSPVDKLSKYTQEAGLFAGIEVPNEANASIMEALKQRKYLIYSSSLTHSYPHCWRCNSKLIFRATEQWFINVQKIKKKMLKANSKIVWNPMQAKQWFAEAVESSPDWCISRQRYWGTPIPIWMCDSCNDYDVVGSIEELMKLSSLMQQPHDLHRPYVDKISFPCTKCGKGKMTRIKDIFDVWYDSGISHTASLTDQEFKRLYPADWITESRDQIRGWFSVLLRTSVALYSSGAFKSVNIGGMIKDELGQEMHRHLGNAILADDILTITSADGFRLWCSSHPRWLELKLKKSEMQEADSNIITIYNIAQLVKELSATAKYQKGSKIKRPSIKTMQSEERWIVSRLNTLIQEISHDLENYLIDEAVKKIRNFILEDLSRFYLKIAKKNITTEPSKRSKSIIDTIRYIFYNVLIILSPITPFTSEKLYLDLYNYNQSIFLEKWPSPKNSMIDKSLEDDFEIAKDVTTAILASREKENIKLRWPIQSAIIEVTDDNAYGAIQRLSQIIESYTNSKTIQLKRIEATSEEVRPEFAKIGPEFKQHADLVAQSLKLIDSKELLASIQKIGHYPLSTDKGTFSIRAQHFSVTKKAGSESDILFKHGKVSIDKSMSDELMQEALMREFERRVQLIRKEMMLKKSDIIEIQYYATGQMQKAISNNSAQICKNLNSKKLKFSTDPTLPGKVISIEGEDVRIHVIRH